MSEPARFEAFCVTAEAVGSTSKRLEKAATLGAYFGSLSDDDLPLAARWFGGYVFSLRDQRNTNIGGAALLNAVEQVSGGEATHLRERLVTLGDPGDMAQEAFMVSAQSGLPPTLTLLNVADALAQLAATTGAKSKLALVAVLLRQATPLEAKYLVKLLAGDLRIGLKEGAVEDALARLAQTEVGRIQWVNMLTGDLGETALLARRGQLDTAQMRLFHPLKFMLATPAADLTDVARQMPSSFVVEDKFDGIRAQAHIAPDVSQSPAVPAPPGEGAVPNLHGVVTDGVRVALFSRTLDEITGSFPDLVAPLAGLLPNPPAASPPTPPLKGRGGDATSSPAPPLKRSLRLPGEGSAMAQHDPLAENPNLLEAGTLAPLSPLPFRGGVGGEAVGGLGSPGLILDGEIVPVRGQDILPFQILQQRLNRKVLTAEMLQGIPVAFVAYDALYGPNATLLNAPFTQRRQVLESLAYDRQTTRLAPSRTFEDVARLDDEFDAARQRGNEGLMVKAPDAAYKPGRRGRDWLKIKRAIATLDVVVTAAEVGSGRRSKFLSDYTFAVRTSEEDATLLNVGKAYSGITDEEMATLSEWFRAHTLQTFAHGKVHLVEPHIVFEVTFDRVQPSARHKSGYALRFPRILRIRDDKPLAEIDTLATVKRLAETMADAGADPQEVNDAEGNPTA